MRSFLVIVSAAALTSVFLYCSVETWRLYTRRRRSGRVMDYLTMALICGLMTWQSVEWLRDNRPDADQVRYVAVWLELVSSAGITSLMLMSATITKARALYSR